MIKKSGLSMVVAALFSAPLYAQNATPSGFDGFVSGAFGSTKAKSADTFSSREMASDFRATFAYTGSMGFGVQLDQVYSNSKASSGVESLKVSTTDTAAHLFYRLQPGQLIGVFAQQRGYDFDLNPDISEDSGDLFLNGLLKKRNLFGVEGQVFFGNFGLSAQLGTQKQNYRITGAPKLSGNFASLDGDYFLSDNWKVGARYGQSKLSTDSIGGDFKSKTFGFQSEYQFANYPLGVFASYDHIVTSFSVDVPKFKEDRLMVGVKLTFGSRTLMSQAQSGASLNPVRSDDKLGLFSTAFLAPPIP